MSSAFRLYLLPFLLSQALALPSGVWIRDGGEEPAFRERLEITVGKHAFYHDGGDVRPAEIEEEGDTVRIVQDGVAPLTLTPGKNGGWTDQKGGTWAARDEVLKIDPAWTEVTLRLGDQFGPVPEGFGITYRILNESGYWDPLLVTPLLADGGVVVIKAPLNGSIHLRPEHPDFPRGYYSGRSEMRIDGAGELNLEFARGQKFVGTVADAMTGEVLVGARVFPMVLTPPIFTPERSRPVVSDAQGKFEIRGVERSLWVDHPDHESQKVEISSARKSDDGSLLVVLERGEAIGGIVTDASGRPLKGVEVSGDIGKETLSDAEGKFRLAGLSRWAVKNTCRLYFSKEGFEAVTLEVNEIDAAGVNVAMDVPPNLTGRVLDVGGRPVASYRLSYSSGSAPTRLWQSLDVIAADGRFSFSPKDVSKDAKELWIGVESSGYARWEGLVSLDQLKKGGFELGIVSGRSLLASVILPATATGLVTAELTPLLPGEQSPGKVFGSLKESFKPGGMLVFNHLKPGPYELRIFCAGAVPQRRSITLKDENIDIGEVRLGGCGIVSGKTALLAKITGPWAFADGEVLLDGFQDPVLKFRTDRDGKFRLPSVPAGEVEIKVTFDFGESLYRRVAKVTVPEGGEVEAIFDK
ncbi:carboxypeptidase-like regulatory domain-containing protein [Luteolibacter flavescens]|uniref:Carboxypeptidase-like regulatory domain-containing protein n=1 Tax=Luteolibacter flavescens TaxID=1859460 RepID=A0ABT3FTT5_9BACT|nr:carboxypeptidase-like regulatory domain-containing protein [Luteolibacter flavescens]MCW1886973.1 carboxypeptidase-like regulatory domain-containing protein [Luteolibacter flavescens]